MLEHAVWYCWIVWTTAMVVSLIALAAAAAGLLPHHPYIDNLNA